jgi:hypothetical protein
MSKKRKMLTPFEQLILDNLKARHTEKPESRTAPKVSDEAERWRKQNVRVGRLPESRSVRVTPRGAPTTSFWKALNVATNSLTVRHVEPSEPIKRTQREWNDRIYTLR